jgi:site-specific DNA-methyltransferase (adenine-specific)
MLILGDCLEEMQKLINDGTHVDSVVTDPPYHLTSITERFGKENSAPAQYGTDGAFARTSRGFMGKEWDGGDIAFRKETWKLAYDLLKPGGHLLAFSSSRTYHRMAVAIEDAGFEIRDQIMWIYGSGFPKSLNIGREVDKKFGNEREVVGEVRAGKNALGQDSGWNKHNNRTEIEVTKGNSEWEGWGTALKPAHEPIVMARKPISEKSVANNVLKHETGGINIDACRIELSESDDPRLGGKGSWKTDKMAKNVYVGWHVGKNTKSHELGRFPANVIHDGLQEEWARYFYCPKTSSEERDKGLYGVGEKNVHPTVKPEKLMQYLVRLVTPKSGTVLDPFMGSGSTGLACQVEGFDFIGIEKEREYFDIAKARTDAPFQRKLF